MYFGFRTKTVKIHAGEREFSKIVILICDRQEGQKAFPETFPSMRNYYTLLCSQNQMRIIVISAWCKDPHPLGKITSSLLWFMLETWRIGNAHKETDLIFFKQHMWGWRLEQKTNAWNQKDSCGFWHTWKLSLDLARWWGYMYFM